MLTFLTGVGCLILMLAFFTFFSYKCPKGLKAMSGMASAAVATFLIEAVFKFVFGDLMGIEFLGKIGEVSGSLAGTASAALVPLAMGVNPLYAIVGGVACGGFNILTGFIAGYAIGLMAPYLEKYLPAGVDAIFGSMFIATFARGVATVIDPVGIMVLKIVGGSITAATYQDPLLMGLILGGVIKVVCTSPLSSMALTAMLGLTGLPMGIAAIACVAGSFTNGIIFYRLNYGNKANVIAVMLEPLTQAPLVTKYPVPIFTATFFGGAMGGLSGAFFNIINNAPGTAAPIPGLLTPFGFNPAGDVFMAIAFAAVGGIIVGLICSVIFKNHRLENPEDALKDE